MILVSLQRGLARVWANRRMIWIFYAANLFFGLLLMLPVYAVLRHFLADSELGAMLGGRLDMDFLFEFLRHNRALSPVMVGLALVVPAMYWLFSLFLSGGALTLLARDQNYDIAGFWSSAGQYFGRFVRLALWSLPLLGAILCLQLIAAGVQQLAYGSDPHQTVTYWGNWVRVGLRGLGLLLFAMIFDYARINAVLAEQHNMRLSLWAGLQFTFANFLQTFGLVLLLFMMGALALLLYNPLADSLAAPNWLIVLLLFLLQQAYMLFRTILRLVTFAGQLHLYQHLNPCSPGYPFNPAR